MSFFRKPGEQHADGGDVLLERCRSTRMMLGVSRAMDRLDVFEVSKAGSLAPIKELADHVIVSDW
jgi:hypothetical protein